MSATFEDTGSTVLVGSKERPVLKLGKRFFAGDDLSILNPHGWPGRVWSSKSVELLQARVSFATQEAREDLVTDEGGVALIMRCDNCGSRILRILASGRYQCDKCEKEIT